ncbi:MAG: respiratory nitrate reductase subunit beta [Dehalococcoidia bacterium]|nr:respiratory nitrate reductase subunit beta [Dehalococcoidia bacterium]
MTATAPGRQLAMVFDLNKCLGCQSCTVACKTLWTDAPGMEAMWWNIVNTMPGRGTPRDAFSHGGGYSDGEPVPGRFPSLAEYGEAWSFDHAATFEAQGERIPLHPTGRDGAPPEWGPNWDEDLGGGTYPNSYYFYLQQVCANCSRPACLEACPRDSLYRREEDGIILVDEERCHGYRFCAEACPYKRIYFNPVRAVAQKCIGCYPRLEAGVAPACVRQCPGRARHIDYMENRQGHPYQLVHEWKVALPLRADFGTEPNVFYIPPLSPPAFNERGEFDEANPRVPTEYLRELFGPGVDAALATIQQERETVASGGQSALMDMLISREWNDLLGPFTENPAGLDRPPAR